MEEEREIGLMLSHASNYHLPRLRDKEKLSRSAKFLSPDSSIHWGKVVDDQLETLTGLWKAAPAENGDMTEASACAALQQLDPLWDELLPTEQARIVQLLVERIEVRTDGIEVRLRVDGRAGVVRGISGTGAEGTQAA